MKKAMMMTGLIALSYGLQAQNKKGNWLVGGSFGAGSYNSGKSQSSYSLAPGISKSTSNTFNVNFYPSIGKFITDKAVIGIEPGIGFYSSKSKGSSTVSSATNTSKSNYTYLSIGPFGRFYFGGLNEKGMPFAQVNFGISFYPGYKTDYSSSNGTAYTQTYSNYRPWSAGVRIGYEHFFNQSVGLQYYIGYSHSSSDYDYEVDYTSASGTDYTGHYESDYGYVNFGAGLVIRLSCDKKKK